MSESLGVVVVWAVLAGLVLALVWAVMKKSAAERRNLDLEFEAAESTAKYNREHDRYERERIESGKWTALAHSWEGEAKQAKDEANTLKKIAADLDELAKKNGLEMERLNRVVNGLQGDYERCSAEYEQSLAKVAELERLLDKRDDMLIKACAEADRFRIEADTLKKSAAVAMYDDVWYRCISEFVRTTPGAKLLMAEKKIVLDTVPKTDRHVLYRVDVPAVNRGTKTFRDVAEIRREIYETFLFDSSGTVLARFPSDVGYMALREPVRKGR